MRFEMKVCVFLESFYSADFCVMLMVRLPIKV